jgi:hypothetical protein
MIRTFRWHDWRSTDLLASVYENDVDVGQLVEWLC